VRQLGYLSSQINGCDLSKSSKSSFERLRQPTPLIICFPVANSSSNRGHCPLAAWRRMSATVEPRIHYSKTSDGVSIAYWTLGVGTPFLLLPSSIITPSMRHWATERGRRWFTRLAENRMLIRYDS